MLAQHSLPACQEVGLHSLIAHTQLRQPRRTLRAQRPKAPHRGTAVRAEGSSSGDPGQENELLNKIKSPALSLFTPYKNLPKPGQIADEEDLMCNAELYNCRTPVYVYEEKCTRCFGTGYVRRRSGSRGGRGSLCKCLSCTGLGFVRRTTTRFEPTVPTDSDNGTQFSVARTLPPGEAEKPRQPPPEWE